MLQLTQLQLQQQLQQDSDRLEFFDNGIRIV